MTVDSSDPARPASLWRNGDFLKFWMGQTISVFGSAITDLALPLTAATVLNANAGQMGILNALGTLPFLVVGLFAGVWVDRSRRRPILIVADIARAFIIGAIPLAMALDALHLALVYAVTLLAGVARVFFDVAYQAYLPALVGREHLVEGNSKLEISFSAAAVAGPGMAGVLVRLLTAPFALAFDAASFLVSAAFLAIIGTQEPQAASPAQRPGVGHEIRDGLRVVFGNRILWSIAGSTGTFNLFSAMWNSVYVLYLTRDLGLTPEVIGFIFAAGGPGALLGALLAQRFALRLGLGRTIIAAQLLAWLAGLLIPLARGTTLVIAVTLAISGFLLGVANVVYNVNQVSLRQAITPNRLLGRMTASMRFLVWGTIPLGALIGGAIGTAFGVEAAIVVGTVGAVLATAWVFFSPVRTLRTQPAPAED
jgi:MFS family permease